MKHMQDAGRVTPHSRAPATRPPGVLQTIAEGFSLVMAVPALIIVPILLDAIIWAGFRISPRHLIRDSSVAADGLGAVGLADNLLPAAAIFVPSLLATAPGEKVSPWLTSLRLEPAGTTGVMAALLLVLIVGSLLHALFAVPLALVAQERSLTVPSLVGMVARTWWRLLTATLVAIIVVGGLSAGLLLGAKAYGGSGTALAAAAVTVVIICAIIYLQFTPEAIVLGGAAPLRAFGHSITVVRSAFWPSVGLVVSLALISSSLAELWLAQASSAAGRALGIAAHAFIGTALAMASTLFYLHRMGGKPNAA